MNDFDYDVMQKKRIARGAAHMKRGSKSRKCSLPSDHLTAAELKRRNGPVATYKLDAPMKWDEFKAMPDDLKKQYILNMRELYSANDKMLGGMLGVHFSTVGIARKELGITEPMPRMDGEKKARREAMWKAFCNGVVGGGDVVEEAPEKGDETAEDPHEDIKVEPVPASEPHSEVPVESEQERYFSPGGLDSHGLYNFICNLQRPVAEPVKPKPLGLSNLSASFTGEFNPASFLEWIRKLPMPEGQVRIQVEVRAV